MRFISVFITFANNEMRTSIIHFGLDKTLIKGTVIKYKTERAEDFV